MNKFPNCSKMFTYLCDHKWRLVYKHIVFADGSPSRDISYLWDDFNIIRETIVCSTVTNITHNVWGHDLTCGLQTAGGVGGLLAVCKTNGIFFPAYDANGNITEYISYNGDVIASTSYDPFGRMIDTQGDISHFSHWFSTKPWCEYTGLYEYQYRKYDSNIGRWKCRDPIGEFGGVNLFSLVNNAPSLSVDKYGNKVVNNSSHPVVIKPEDSTKGVILMPKATYSDDQDGVYLCISKDCSIFKSVDGVDITVKPNNEFDWKGRNPISSLGQYCRGGCKDSTFISEHSDWPSLADVKKLCDKAYAKLNKTFKTEIPVTPSTPSLK